MLSGEGIENGEKTTIGLISKKTLHVQHNFFCTFLCCCFARRNVKIPETSGRSRGGARGARPLPLYVDQTEARRAEKKIF